MGFKKSLKELALKTRRFLEEEPQSVPFDNAYPWLGYIFHELMKDPICRRKPMYIWGTVQGVALGKILAMDRISVIEFGVGGGGGLISLEHIGEILQSKLEIAIDVFGFDTGVGLPRPRDYRDQPNMWVEGQLPMKIDRLKCQLHHAHLILGLVKDTIPVFLKELPSPIAFVSFDLDLYHSTRDALSLFKAEYKCLLPRVICYFDDIIGHTYNDSAGERLAISEFNCTNLKRKISPIYGLKYFVPGRYSREFYWDLFYYAHFFEHPLYNTLDSINKAMYVDEQGKALRVPVHSKWKEHI